jgi:hypothetical protein
MANTYTLIASNVLSSSAASVTFSAIPATYTDLVVRCSIRTNQAVVNPAAVIRFNGDTGSNYSYTVLEGSGSAASSARSTPAGFMNIGRYNGSTSTSNVFGSGEVYIPSYTVAQNKPVSAVGMGEDNATTASMAANAGLWLNTAAITTVAVATGSGTFDSGSSFYLYGIKNS